LVDVDLQEISLQVLEFWIFGTVKFFR